MKGFRWVMLVLLAGLPAQSQNLYKQFEYVSIEGRVVTRAGQPVADCMVELRTLSNQQPEYGERAGNSSGAMPTGWGASDIGVVGTESYDVSGLKKAGWDRTDANGYYKIEGIPSPGSYVLVVKGQEGFKKTQMPMRVDKPRGEVLKARDLILDSYGEKEKAVEKILAKAQDAINQDDLVQAERLLDEAEAKSAQVPNLFVMKGNVSVKQRNWEAALDAYDKAYTLGEQNEQLCRTAAQIAFQLTKFDQTMKFVECALASTAEDAGLVYLMGVSAYNAREFSVAEQYLQQYYEMTDGKADDVSFLYVFGMTELEMGQQDRAAEFLHKAYRNGLKADVNFMKTLAMLYIQQDKDAEAKEILNDLLEKFPEFEGREKVARLAETL